MNTLQITGRKLEIEFSYAQQGHRVTVWEWVGGELETLSNWDYVLCLGATHFDTLCSLASDLWEDASLGETMAEILGVEMRTADDADCVKCGAFYHYADMVHGTDALPEIATRLELGYWDYACLECYETLAVEMEKTNA